MQRSRRMHRPVLGTIFGLWVFFDSDFSDFGSSRVAWCRLTMNKFCFVVDLDSVDAIQDLVRVFLLFFLSFFFLKKKHKSLIDFSRFRSFVAAPDVDAGCVAEVTICIINGVLVFLTFHSQIKRSTACTKNNACWRYDDDARDRDGHARYACVTNNG